MKFDYAIVFLQKAKNISGNSGDAGHFSPYFSHAKRALYHLSYILVNKISCVGFFLSRNYEVFFRRKSASVNMQ